MKLAGKVISSLHVERLHRQRGTLVNIVVAVIGATHRSTAKARSEVNIIMLSICPPFAAAPTHPSRYLSKSEEALFVSSSGYFVEK